MPTKVGNFFIGTLFYGLIALFGSVIMAAYVRSKTTDKTMVNTNGW